MVVCCFLVFGVIILAFLPRVEHWTPRFSGVVVSFSGFGFFGFGSGVGLG